MVPTTFCSQMHVSLFWASILCTVFQKAVGKIENKATLEWLWLAISEAQHGGVGDNEPTTTSQKKTHSLLSTPSPNKSVLRCVVPLLTMKLRTRLSDKIYHDHILLCDKEESWPHAFCLLICSFFTISGWIRYVQINFLFVSFVLSEIWLREA